MPRRQPSREKIQKWLTFLHNHRPEIAAMDFFVMPTFFFRQLYCFFIISHGMRKIIHVGATFHPNGEWVKERLTEIFTARHSLKYMVYDRDSIFSSQVAQTLKNLNIETIRTSYRSPWQNGIAERFIGSVRHELLNHVIVFNENHLIRLMNEYLDYYHNDRTHYALNKDSPKSRPIENKPSKIAKVLALPRVGGLHHRYFWKESA